MNSRQRFLETMRRGTPDRVPCFEEGLRDGVLEAWREQGLPGRAELSEMFRYDRRESVPVDLRPGGTASVRPTSRRALGELARRLDPEDPQRLGPDWAQRVGAWRTREHVLGLPIHRGLFLTMGVGDWQTFLDVMYQLSDAPALVRDVMALQAEFAVRLADRILADVEVDFVSFSEPIGGNDGPLLSPRMYKEIVLASYRPILELVRNRGVETIVLETYGNPRPLLPCVLEAGFNCLWAHEASGETMDYLALRREFGPDLGLIGGIDLDVLLGDKAAIRREIERKVPALLAQGRYIPLADGRVRENVPFENYRYYRRLLEELAARA